MLICRFQLIFPPRTFSHLRVGPIPPRSNSSKHISFKVVTTLVDAFIDIIIKLTAVTEDCLSPKSVFKKPGF